MSYTALYRKFRPSTFDEVRGQDHIVTALKNQINTGRIGHAYLFTGTRGTGKTSVAKIFARAVNCEDPQDGSPCGKCDTCKAISSGAALNVIEIDAASNNGVDSIREIINEVSYSPASGKYKVYIIDEVHMLSAGAFNALLKTLEEPPAYVIFILATTEVQKIPITILSRCQRYDFRRISVDTLSKQLQDITSSENIKAEKRALDFIARMADGSSRDALSLLDQCSAFYYGQELTYDNVLNVLGAVDTTVFSRFLRAVLSNDVEKCIESLDEVVSQGRELSQFVNDFIHYLRNLMILEASDQTGGEIENILNVSSDNMKLLREEAQIVPLPIVIRYIRIFADLSNQLRYAAQKRTLIEIALIRMCRPQMETDHDSELDRIRALENEIEELKANGIACAGNAGDKGTRAGIENEGSGSSDEKETEDPDARKIDPALVPTDVNKIALGWNKFVDSRETAMMKFWLPKFTFSVDSAGKPYLVTDNEDADAWIQYRQEHGTDQLNLIELNRQVESYFHMKIELTSKKAENMHKLRHDDPDYVSQLINAHIVISDDDAEAAFIEGKRGGKSEPEPKPEIAPQTAAEPKPEAAPQTAAEPKPEAAPQTAAEPKPEAAPQTAADPESEVLDEAAWRAAEQQAASMDSADDDDTGDSDSSEENEEDDDEFEEEERADAGQDDGDDEN